MENNNVTRLNYQMIFEEKIPDNDTDDYQSKLISANLKHEKQIKHWQERLKRECEKAYKHGLKEGIIIGKNEANAELEKKITVLKKAFEAAHQQWLNLQEETAPGLINLACDIAEKIIASKPKNDSNIIKKTEAELRSVLKKMNSKTRTELKVNHLDAEIAKKLINEFDDELTVKIILTEECSQGEFILEDNDKKLIRKFKLMLNDFKKKSVILSHWD